MSDNKQNSDEVDISEQRRKVLKASVATPLVATLTFGSGQALASAYQCVDNSQPTLEESSTPNHDKAVRVVMLKYVNDSNSLVIYARTTAGPFLNANGTNSGYTTEEEVWAAGYNPSITVYTLAMFGTFRDGNNQVIEITNTDGSTAWPEYQMDNSQGFSPLFNTCFCSATDENGITCANNPL